MINDYQICNEKNVFLKECKYIITEENKMVRYTDVEINLSSDEDV